MFTDLQDKVKQSVKTLLADLSVDSFDLYRTRDFWGNCDENDFLSAYQEAAQYYREAITCISETLGCDGIVMQRGESNFPSWLRVNEACFWYLEERSLVLYWEHQDKELPVIVRLYAFNPNQTSHRLLNYELENQFSIRVYYDSEENKIRMLDADDTPTKVRNIIFHCFRTFPSKRIAEALSRNINKDYGSFTSDDVRAEILQQNEKLNKFGDTHLLSPDEFRFFMNLDEEGIVRLLESPQTSPALRTRAALRVWEQPSAVMIEALEQSKGRIFDRHLIPDVIKFICEAQERLQEVQ